jgi:hypothetical protein
MGSEIAIPIFGPLIIIGVAALLYLALAGRSFAHTESALLGLGRRRLAMGYLGALMVLAVYNYIDTVDLSRAKVTRGDVTAAEAARYFWGWYIYGLCLITPFVIFFITVLGLPLLALLRRLEFASVLGGVAMSATGRIVLLTVCGALSRQSVVRFTHVEVLLLRLYAHRSSRRRADIRLRCCGSTSVVAQSPHAS